MPISIPRLVIAGTASGVGKTTATVGLIRALRARGLDVAVFKCGPDYLDPTYHARAAGRRSHNLDGWMMGRGAVLSTFARATSGADIAVIEGVMGLFDGASAESDEGSTAEIARWLGAPVLLVVDGSGMARTIAAVAHGFKNFDPNLKLAGLLCNRLGSTGHLDLLRKAAGVPPVVGGLPDDPEFRFPERHLGLRTADEDAVPERLLRAWGERVAQWCDLETIIAIARSAPPLTLEPETEPPASGPGAARCRLAVAFDEAFHFYYEDNLRRLESLGAKLNYFSPIHDRRLPAADGLYIGGGYPEVHAEALAENRAMLEEIVAFAARGGAIYAECGGLMYLSAAIRTLEGRAHRMAGLIPAEAVMFDRLRALGYVEVETRMESPLGPAGLSFRGHQFRYSELRPLSDQIPTAYEVRRRRGGAPLAEGYLVGNVLASYVHAHWASNPAVAEGLVRGLKAAAR